MGGIYDGFKRSGGSAQGTWGADNLRTKNYGVAQRARRKRLRALAFWHVADHLKLTFRHKAALGRPHPGYPSLLIILAIQLTETAWVTHRSRFLSLACRLRVHASILERRPNQNRIRTRSPISLSTRIQMTRESLQEGYSNMVDETELK